MRVDNLKVRWMYSVVEVERDGEVYNTEMTECFITGDGDITLAQGQALCSVYEYADKDKGRKISMSRALGTLTQKASVTNQTPEFIKQQKEFRAKFWEAYRTMTKRPRWCPPSLRSRKKR